MEELDNILDNKLNTKVSSVDSDQVETTNENLDSLNNSTDLIEYKEIEKPCVALTIIGENRLTNAEVFIKSGFRFSIKAFFSTLVLTIMNMFI